MSIIDSIMTIYKNGSFLDNINFLLYSLILLHRDFYPFSNLVKKYFLGLKCHNY